MTDEWVETTLGDVVSVSRERVDPRVLEPTDLVHYSIPVLDATNEPALEASSLIQSHKFKVSKDSILVSLLNPRIPRVWLARGVENAVCSTEFAVLSPKDPQDLSVEFLHLLCQADDFWIELQKRAVGSTGSRQRAKVDGLLGIPIALPPLPVQRRIVDLLAHLDNHLANLQTERDQLATTFAAASAVVLTGKWEGIGLSHEWEQVPLAEVAEFVNGYAFKPEHLNGTEVPVVRIKQLLDPTADVDYTDIPVPEKNRISDGDLIFSWSGTLASRFWDRGPAALNQHLFRVHPKGDNDIRWLQLVLEHAVDDLLAKTHGTTMKHVTKGVLEAHLVFRPPVADQVEAACLLGSLNASRAGLDTEIASLREWRHSFLSGLLSRAIELPPSYDSLLPEVA